MAENAPPQHGNGQNGPLQKEMNAEDLDTRSAASSASELQMSLLENKFENEMSKMANMVKEAVSLLQNSVPNITEKFERKLSEIEQKLNNLATDRVVLENQNTKQKYIIVWSSTPKLFKF